MNTTDLKDLAAQAIADDQKATKGPWYSVEYPGFVCVQLSDDHDDQDILNEKAINYPDSENFRFRENGAFIAAARTREPQLARAMLAMLPYVRHDEGCLRCDCGLDAALESLR